MIRQRIRFRTPFLAYLPRLLTLILALGLVWYGSMVVLLAVKVSPHTVNSISAYRSLYGDVTRLRAADFTTPVRFIAGFGGAIVALVLLYLAAQVLPRPSLARGNVELEEHQRGSTIVQPRAVERVAELAAEAAADVSTASARLGEQDLNIHVTTRRATQVAATLVEVRSRVHADLERHELPDLPVNVMLTGYDRKTKRELS